MYCPNCGHQIEETAKFCSNCGKPTAKSTQQTASNAQSPTQQTEWEYRYYRLHWEWNKGGKFYLFGKSEYDARLFHWGQDQSRIMRELQEWMDKGWQPVTPPGPGCYTFRKREDFHFNGVNDHWLEAETFLVELRRPATPLQDRTKLLLGTWEKEDEPKPGLIDRMLGKKLVKASIMFHKDYRFEARNQDGNYSFGGTYYVTHDDEFFLMNKHTLEWDFSAKIEGDRLLLSNSDHKVTYRYVRAQAT